MHGITVEVAARGGNRSAAQKLLRIKEAVGLKYFGISYIFELFFFKKRKHSLELNLEQLG